MKVGISNTIVPLQSEPRQRDPKEQRLNRHNMGQCRRNAQVFEVTPSLGVFASIRLHPPSQIQERAHQRPITERTLGHQHEEQRDRRQEHDENHHDPDVHDHAQSAKRVLLSVVALFVHRTKPDMAQHMDLTHIVDQNPKADDLVESAIIRLWSQIDGQRNAQSRKDIKCDQSIEIHLGPAARSHHDDQQEDQPQNHRG